MSSEEYPVYGGCDSCEHQSEICTDCMKQNTMGEWVHSKYSPKPGVYTLPNQRQVTTDLVTTKLVTA